MDRGLESLLNDKLHVLLCRDPRFYSQHPQGCSKLSNASPRESDSPGPLQALHTCGTHSYMKAKHPYT